MSERSSLGDSGIKETERELRRESESEIENNGVRKNVCRVEAAASSNYGRECSMYNYSGLFVTHIH